MPQDVPIEASETLAFTPDCLSKLEDPPVFTLRAVTTREKRFRSRLHREEGIINHPEHAIRAEILNGLKALWTPSDYEQHAPVIEAYWKAEEEFLLQKQEDEDIVWEYDPAVEMEVKALSAKLERSWPPLARMAADIAEFNAMEPLFYMAVTVQNWIGLDVQRHTDRGYLTIDCTEAMANALAGHDLRAGAAPGTAWTELYAACLKRFYLTEEEGVNFESPAPSGTNQEPSNGKKRPAARGKSPAQANSKPTRRKG